MVYPFQNLLLVQGPHRVFGQRAKAVNAGFQAVDFSIAGGNVHDVSAFKRRLPVGIGCMRIDAASDEEGTDGLSLCSACAAGQCARVTKQPAWNDVEQVNSAARSFRTSSCLIRDMLANRPDPLVDSIAF